MSSTRSPLGALALLSLLGLLSCSAGDPSAFSEGSPGAAMLAYHDDGCDDDCPSFPRTVGGFDTPESAYWDEGTDAWYVSNMAGEVSEFLANPTAKDGVGWITKLDRCGNVVEAQWVSGLNAPKGIRVADGKLYTPDMDELVIVDLATRAVSKIPAPGAIFLNDLAIAGDGSVYVSDSFAHTIWRFKDGRGEIIFSDAILNHPNGLLVNGDRLMIASLGAFGVPSSLGKLWELDLRTRVLRQFGTLEAKLDGIERYRNGYLVSENEPPLVYFVTASSSTLVHDFRSDGLQAINDIGLDRARRLLGVPAFLDDTVTFYPLPTMTGHR
ncbi:hypothetical protein ACMHYB_20060 [Sorangium sp. So ce1128]